MYLLAITGSLVVAYVALHQLYPYFFTGAGRRMSIGSSFVSIAIIVICSLAGYWVVLNTSDLELGNRILHGFGGAFIAYLVCFLAMRDSRLAITRFQFFVSASLIVTGLGVANEILEFFLQNYGGMVFLRTTNDTWLDLISNAVGIAIASAVLVPFARPPRT